MERERSNALSLAIARLPGGDFGTMLSHVQSSAVLGIDAYLVNVEVDVSSGMPMARATRWVDRLFTE